MGRQDVQCELMAYPAKTDRESILAAALEQVESEGLENLAIRSLAGRLGLAPNALYRYFENLSDLELAVRGGPLPDASGYAAGGRTKRPC